MEDRYINLTHLKLNFMSIILKIIILIPFFRDWNHPLMVDVHLSLAIVLEIMELQGGQIRLCYDRDN